MVLSFLLLGLAPATATEAQDEYFDYQIAFPDAPASGHTALARPSLDARREATIRFMACGKEIQFLNMVQSLDASWLFMEHAGENLTAILVGKISWLARMRAQNSDEPCSQTIRVSDYDLGLNKLDGVKPLTLDQLTESSSGSTTKLQDTMSNLFGDACRNQPVQTAKPSSDKSYVEVEFKLSLPCLRAEINRALTVIQVVGQLGSSDVPCYGVGGAKTKGEWDVALRDLMRLYLINENNGRAFLDEGPRNHVRDDLFIVGSAPAAESYSVSLECGNSGKVTGSPQDRADDRAWTDGIGEALGDILRWLLVIILVIVVIVCVVLAIFSGGTTLVVAALIVGAIIALATAVLLAAEVPETENHLLMINSSVFLNNQIIIKELGPNGNNVDNYVDDKENVKERLLRKMQALLQGDFEEFNARPYQRYSITALLNLADFAEDDKIKQGARMVIDFATAKFAIGSNQGRRIVPFRRRLESIAAELQDFNHGGAPRPYQQKIFDLDSDADHMVGFMLLYAGQTQQLHEWPTPAGKRASRSSMADMIYAASSGYQPEEMVVDLAIDKSQPYMQRIRHDGVEIYSSKPGFLITAGGIETGSVNGLKLGPLSIGHAVNDLGAAMPTTLIPRAGALQLKRNDFIRIEGATNVHHDDDKRLYSFDHNLCVWSGFACGINLIVPDSLNGCISGGPAGSSWRFLDSTACQTLQPGPKFYVAIYTRPCPASADGCVGDYGFFEAVDNPSDSFDAFQAKVIAANSKVPTLPPASAPDAQSTYYAYNGEAITFNCMSHQNASDHWGIEGINMLVTDDLSKWNLAAGDIMTAKGDGLVRIKRGNATLDLDFRQWGTPLRSLY